MGNTLAPEISPSLRKSLLLHGGDDIWTQARYRVEHRLVGRPVGRRPEVRAIDLPSLRPALRIHLIDLRIREDDPAASPLTPAPLEADGRQRHPARIRIAAMREGKGKDVVSHQQAYAVVLPTADSLAVRLPTRQDTQHLQRPGGVVIAEADAPVAHAEPPLIRGAL